MTTNSNEEVVQNPDALAAFQALVEEQHVAHLVGVPAKFEHMRNFIYTADGAFEVQTRAFANFTVKLKKVEGGINKKMTEGVEFKAGKIPFYFLQRALAWFRLAYAQPRKSEALYIIMWDTVNNCYVEYVPRQYDGPAHAKEIDATERPENCILVAHIHSHPGFGGKFSGIDNGDDRKCSDAAMFGVIGYVNREHPEMEWRASVAGEYVTLHPHDIFTSALDLTRVMDPVPHEWLDRIEDSPLPPATYPRPPYQYGRYAAANEGAAGDVAANYNNGYNWPRRDWDDELGWM